MGTLPDNLDGLEPRPRHHFHRRNGSADGRVYLQARGLVAR
jgi:hypothetical protein